MGKRRTTKIINTLASTNYQAHNDRQSEQKKGMQDFSISYAIMAQNNLLPQQIEALTAQMSKMSQ